MPAKPLSILFFGDIVGKPARKAVAALMPEIKKEYKPDLTIANVENLAHGIGVTSKTLTEMREVGIDFFTSGNHVWGKPEIYDILKDPDFPMIRPDNYGSDSPGTGHKTVMVGQNQVLVINLHGQVFIEEELSNPFHALDAILQQYKKNELAAIIVDFHAEATSEKVAFGWYADGRVSAVLGTHTHIPTADDTILPQGTGYITDVGMAGRVESVIGIDKDIIVDKFTEKDSRAHDISDHGDCVVNAVALTIDTTTKKTTAIKRIQKYITI